MTTSESHHTQGRAIEDVTLPDDAASAPTVPQTAESVILTSPLRARDFEVRKKAYETSEAIAHQHREGNFDAADEILDATYPFGSSFYFMQAVKNARARATAASTVRELDRAEDFHDEFHDYLRWQRRYGNQVAHPGDRLWIARTARQVESINDNDVFWPIARSFCRLAGVEAGLEYVTKKPHHDPITTGLALHKLYGVASERRLPIPEDLHRASREAISQMPEGMIVTRELYRVMTESQQPQRIELPIVQVT